MKLLLCVFGFHNWRYGCERASHDGFRTCTRCRAAEEFTPDYSHVIANYGGGRAVIGGFWERIR